MLPVLLFLTTAASAGDCVDPTSLQGVQASLGQAETAYEHLDLPAFEAAVEQARAQLPCLEAVVPPSVVASLHRTEGLAAFVANQADRAGLAFAASRLVEPTYRFPTTLVPHDNPVLQAFGAVDTASVTVVDVPAPASGTLRFDGQPTRARPEQTPSLFQWVRPEGTVGATGYLWPGDPLPAYPRVPGYPLLAQQPVAEVAPAPRRGWSTRGKLAAGAAGGAVLTGVLYGATAAVHSRYWNPSTPVGPLDELRSTSNGLAVASTVALGLTVGTGALSLAVGP